MIRLLSCAANTGTAKIYYLLDCDTMKRTGKNSAQRSCVGDAYDHGLDGLLQDRREEKTTGGGV